MEPIVLLAIGILVTVVVGGVLMSEGGGRNRDKGRVWKSKKKKEGVPSRRERCTELCDVCVANRAMNCAVGAKGHSGAHLCATHIVDDMQE